MRERRDQIVELVKREMIGPDPIDWEGCLQPDGEEILSVDTPQNRYIAGILYPKGVLDSEAEASRVEGSREEVAEEEEAEEDKDQEEADVEFMDDAEELINRSNAYQQSAMSITVAVAKGDSIIPAISAGYYIKTDFIDPQSEKKSVRFSRRPVRWTNEDKAIELPTSEKTLVKIPVRDTKMQFDITLRMVKGNFAIYTFTLENTNSSASKTNLDTESYFQCEFALQSEKGFVPLPDSIKINVHDLDYLSNKMMYRDVFNYAIGHGCAADWEEKDGKVNRIETAVFPSYEVKPIMPSQITGISLKMYDFGPNGDYSHAVGELTEMCDQYEEWIRTLEKRKKDLIKYSETAERHISNCKTCLQRMREGITLLKNDEQIRIAFQYMNLAMLEQQLHYHLPLQKWEEAGENEIKLERLINVLPDPDKPETWYDREHNHYGQWRPFQIAFVLMNLKSMKDRKCSERDIVDLIWFPTGGGKTEAYLGLSAYTIFIRRLMNREDAGTAIIMRYTLRLLTAQQYERASAMICACEAIRQEHSDFFGENRISIGLWVGGDTTPNRMDEAMAAYSQLMAGKTDDNPFVMLKCPWCGAQMGVFKTEKGLTKLPGYYRYKGRGGKYLFQFRCANTENNCLFSRADSPLPLYIIDEDIYEKKPTLLLGTVDKFATLPMRPQAQGLFGYENGVKVTAPDLIIQDELHLISGPLGSMVGHYETLISELCAFHTKDGDIKPKIIASTATISRAREQCNALYACGKENVFQFPPSGLDAGDSFFAYEDKEKQGRRYVGILASGSPSDTTTAIRLYATLLYAAKQIEVEKESDRDAYWTNIGYFNSLRELGQAATWIHADIDNYLDIIYKRHFLQKRFEREEYRDHRRYIYRDEELTSRIAGDKVSASLSNLNIAYTGVKDEKGFPAETPIDICLATNMISVGLDVPRLGLMTVNGQPKTTSEYIQTTSRVGRNQRTAPGLVFTLYRPGRARDKSHYEHFHDYHSKLYCSVEPTSVTPFSSPVRERAIHALLVGMFRLEAGKEYSNGMPRLPKENIIEYAKDVIRDRIVRVEEEELEDSIKYMNAFLENWEDWNPVVWEGVKRPPDFVAFKEDIPLIYPAGAQPSPAWNGRGKETPTSMRNVDAECEARVMTNRYKTKEEM